MAAPRKKLFRNDKSAQSVNQKLRVSGDRVICIGSGLVFLLFGFFFAFIFVSARSALLGFDAVPLILGFFLLARGTGAFTHREMLSSGIAAPSYLGVFYFLASCIKMASNPRETLQYLIWRKRA